MPDVAVATSRPATEIQLAFSVNAVDKLFPSL